MKKNPDQTLIFPRGCAETSDLRERESHAVRRVRPDALRPVRGLGEPQQAHRNIQKDIPMTCLPVPSAFNAFIIDLLARRKINLLGNVLIETAISQDSTNRAKCVVKRVVLW